MQYLIFGTLVTAFLLFYTPILTTPVVTYPVIYTETQPIKLLKRYDAQYRGWYLGLNKLRNTYVFQISIPQGPTTQEEVDKSVTRILESDAVSPNLKTSRKKDKTEDTVTFELTIPRGTEKMEMEY